MDGGGARPPRLHHMGEQQGRGSGDGAGGDRRLAGGPEGRSALPRVSLAVTRHVALRASGVAAVLITAAVLLAACDESHSFILVNKTDSSIVLTLIIALEDDLRTLDKETYVLKPGQSINTGVDPAQSGSRGVSIFYPGSILLVRATSGEQIILDEVYTYDELKAFDFTIEIPQ